MEGSLGLIMFVVIFALILLGYPVALTLAGVATIFGLIFVPDFLDLLPLRIMGVMQNYVLIAVPLFIFMGLMLEKSGLAETLLKTMARLFGKVRGGLAVSVIIVGALLAASTGIVGATVITMGLISLPTMIQQGYNKPLASGTIAASGTLGQIIPPSIVLILLGSVLNVSVGDIFAAAFIPGIILVGIYICFVLIVSRLKPNFAPLPKVVLEESNSLFYKQVLIAFVMPLLLILAVLGSIFTGVASPTEAAAVGALGAIVLAWVNGKLDFKAVKESAENTTKLTAMVFLILIGATTFSLVFRGLGGDDYLTHLITSGNLSPLAFLLLVMVIIFIAGFFIDFIEIIFIFVPVVAPIFISMKMDLIWIGILIALNLQTSFLTPPFGFALFYLKGVAPDNVKTSDIYKGVLPFLILQVILLLIVLFFPSLFGLKGINF